VGYYNVTADINKNVLFVSMGGQLTLEEARLSADLVISEAQKLIPGFNMINDISKLVFTTPEVADEAKRAQLFLGSRGIGRVIRIVDKLALAQVQLERQSRGAGYLAELASTPEEALKILGLQ
jgi:hypothetical protein